MTTKMGLEQVGVQLDPTSFKVNGGFGGDTERTSVSNIYVIGDILKVCGGGGGVAVVYQILYFSPLNSFGYWTLNKYYYYLLLLIQDMRNNVYQRF